MITCDVPRIGRASRAQRLVGLGRPALDARGGHHAYSSCSASGTTSAPAGEPRQADQHHELVGQADERLDRDPLGARPTTPRAARARACAAGFSPASTAPPAPSAQRPDQVASQPARRPASQRPSLRAHDAQRGDALRRVAAVEPQRPADRLELEHQARRRAPRRTTRRAESPSWAGEPRSRSALDRGVGGRDRGVAAARRGVSRQCASTWSSSHGPRARMPGVRAIGVQARWRRARDAPRRARRRGRAGRAAGGGPPRLRCFHEHLPRRRRSRHRPRRRRLRRAAVAGAGAARGAAPASRRRRCSIPAASATAAASCACSRPTARRLAGVLALIVFSSGAQHAPAVPAARRARQGASSTTTRRC